MKKLKELKQTIKGLSIDNEATENNQNVYFHAGLCASFPYKNGTVLIYSQGDILIDIYEKEKPKIILSEIKRKNSRINLKSQFAELNIETDKELEKLFNNENEIYKCYSDANPWWEIMFKTEYDIHELEWCADSYLLGEAIEEAYTNIEKQLKSWDLSN